MRLISCNNCAVFLDHDKLNFPTEIWDIHGLDESKGAYNHFTEQCEAYVPCPVCGEKIFKGENT